MPDRLAVESPEALEVTVALGPLLDLSRALNSSTEQLNIILDAILLTVMGDLLADSAVMLMTRDGTLFVSSAAQGLPRESHGRSISIKEFPKSPARTEDLQDADLRLFMDANGMAVVAPIYRGSDRLALLGLGRRPNEAMYTNTELVYLEMLANLMATSMLSALATEALNNQGQKLSTRLHELQTILELSRDFHRLWTPGEIAQLLIHRAMGVAITPGCLLFLGNNTRLDLFDRRGFPNWESVGTISSSGLLAELERLSDPVPPNQLVGHDDFTMVLPPDAALLVPMHNQDELRGLLVLGKSISGEYSPENISFLSTLGSLSMAVYENARLLQEELEMEEDLRVAASIQRHLLPQGDMQIPGYTLSAKTCPSHHVGGDYYDCIKIDETRYAICVADVSGKGVPAALLLANVQASLRALVAIDSDIGRLATRLNELVAGVTDGEQFVTCFLGILDTERHALHYVNAGHELPRMFSANGLLRTLETSGIVLGIMPGFTYQIRTCPFRLGDTLIMYSDGVTEAFDKHENMFGERRLEDFVESQLDQPVDVILDGLIAEVQKFCGDSTQSDDITGYVLRREI